MALIKNAVKNKTWFKAFDLLNVAIDIINNATNINWKDVRIPSDEKQINELSIIMNDVVRPILDLGNITWNFKSQPVYYNLRKTLLKNATQIGKFI